MITPIRIGAREGYRDLVPEPGGSPSGIPGKVGIDKSLWNKPGIISIMRLLISKLAFR